MFVIEFTQCDTFRALKLGQHIYLKADSVIGTEALKSRYYFQFKNKE